MKLDGKVALVTGTSTNIGGGIAEGLAAAGAALVCVDARAENADDCARYIKSSGGRAAAVTCKIIKPELRPASRTRNAGN